ncbi:MAG TPA: hypothetical protein VKE74_26680 [Gemmataceae bacterium]|nr:hypothetical protein [Gemmataceae bacterium]
MTRYNRRAILGLGVMSAAGLVPLPRAMGRAQPQAPDVSFVVGSRSAAATPVRSGCTHTGGGNIDVQQPALDTLVVTMSGVAVAYGGPTGPASAGLVFEMVQQFEVSFDKPTVKAARLTVEGRVIGFLRSHKVGSAEQCAGAVVSGPGGGLLALAMPAHAVSGCESISINDKEGPAGVVVPAGAYTLNQSFRVTAAMPKCVLPCKAPSAEFAPDPALDPLWISAKEPFHGAAKKDLGFQVVLKVAPEAVPDKK